MIRPERESITVRCAFCGFPFPCPSDVAEGANPVFCSTDCEHGALDYYGFQSPNHEDD